MCTVACGGQRVSDRRELELQIVRSALIWITRSAVSTQSHISLFTLHFSSIISALGMAKHAILKWEGVSSPSLGNTAILEGSLRSQPPG